YYHDRSLRGSLIYITRRLRRIYTSDVRVKDGNRATLVGQFTMGRGAYDTTGLWEYIDIETPQTIISEDISEIEENHLLYRLKEDFLRLVMTTYLASSMKDDEGDGSAGVASGFLGPPQQRSDTRNRCRKRGYSPEYVSKMGLEISNQPPTATKRRAPDRGSPCFACPFAKKDPMRYHDCYLFFLKRIRDVKQHVHRCHRKPIYCPRCKKTFDDEDQRDDHVMSNSCSPILDVVIEGITEKQQRELRQRVSSKLPHDQQWFEIFDIIFSSQPRPRGITPYIHHGLSQEFCMFRDFAQAEGPGPLSDFLEAKGTVTSSLPREEQDLEAFL
ncbi:hypothetical protein F5Y15DRAFT_430909, partial [Xylariaceae sp. FL0016]